MTTIAYNHGILASDGRSSLGDQIYEEDCQKLFTEVGPFLAVGVCGSYQDAIDLLEGIQDYTKIDQIRSIDFQESNIKASFLAVCTGGKLWYYAGESSFELRADKPFAIGSGADYALGAMGAGATAEEAVRVASKFDMGTNSHVQFIDLTEE